MHTLPELPYKKDALEPFIDLRTMDIHHGKHHQGYVTKLNKALEGTDLVNIDVKELLQKLHSLPEKIRTAVQNNGGGHFNHSLFWTIMGPGKGGTPQGKIGELLTKTFGSFENFKEEFGKTALNVFGSGWAWLVVDKGELKVMKTANQNSPISQGITPLLGLDVWEHAYYIKHANKRGDYVKNWWNIVNWEEVEKRYSELS
jgi:superoxide dismutase, Fe-Mn family